MLNKKRSCGAGYAGVSATAAFRHADCSTRNLPARPTSTVEPRPVRASLRKICKPRGLLAFARDAEEYVEM